MAGRKALLVATYAYDDAGLRRLTAPGHDAEALAEVLRDPTVAGFDVTVLTNQPTHVVGEAIADFYGDCRHDDLTLLYFSGHGLKDDSGRLYLAMANTRRDALLFTGLAAAQINEAMDACASRRKVLILDCCYSGAFPAGSTAKSDETVNALERFQGKGRAVLTASDATQYSFEGENLQGTGSRSVFTRYLVEAIRTGEADLDADGDIALDELYSYVHERVVAEMPQQRPKKQEDVDGRIIIARNVNWTLPAHLRYAIDSPIAAQRLGAVDGLAHLNRVGNDMVRAVVGEQIAVLANDDSRSVSVAAGELLARLGSTETDQPPAAAVPAPRPPVPAPAERVASPREAPSVSPSVTPSVTPPVSRPVSPPSPARGAVQPPPPTSPRAAGPDDGPRRPRTGRSSLDLVVGLVVLSAVPLTLARVLNFESSYPFTAGEFGTPVVPWALAVIVPLAVGALLLVLRKRWPRGSAAGYGLVLGAGLVLSETSLFWIAFFNDPNNSYDTGPALWSLFAGWVVVVAAGVVLIRSPLAGWTGIRTDWRLACALAAVVAVAVASSAVSEAENPWIWIQNNVGLVILGLAALAVTVVRLRADQAVAGVIAVTVLGFWLVYFLVRDYVQQDTGIPRSTRQIEIICVAVVVAASAVANAGGLRGLRARAPEPRR